MKPYIYFLFLSACSITSCSTSKNTPLRSASFNLAGSDAIAIDIANQVVDASGGKAAWDETRYVGWNFFGSREHVWDKQTGDVSIKSLRSPVEINMNILTKTGRVWLDGQETNQVDSLSKYLQKGYEWWVNDSYWLVLPFKLQDSGVTLKYLGDSQTQEKKIADVIELTFENVGVTPQNKYHIYVDKTSRHIVQWDFYTKASDEEPRFQIPWKDYKKYGQIYLSGDRGRRQVSDISVGEQLKARMTMLN